MRKGKWARFGEVDKERIRQEVAFAQFREQLQSE